MRTHARLIRRLLVVTAALLPILGLASPASAAGEDFLQQISPSATTYVDWTDFIEMQYSGAGDVTAPVWVVNFTDDGERSPSGCAASDFSGMPAGSIALIQRGHCLFHDKAVLAQAAGAAGVLIANYLGATDGPPAINGTLRTPVNLPVVGATFPLGEDLRNGISNGASGSVVRMVTDGIDSGPPPAQQIDNLKATIDSMDLPPATEQPLDSKLDAARAALDRGNTGAACNQAAAFENHVRAQSGKKLTTEQADALLARAAALRARIGC